MRRGLYSEHKAVQKTYYDRTCALQESCIVNIEPSRKVFTIIRVHCANIMQSRSVYDHASALYKDSIVNIVQARSVYDHASALYEDHIVNIIRSRKVFTIMRVHCMWTL